MCTDKNNDKKKMNLLAPSSTVFLIAEKLLNLLILWNDQNFSLSFLTLYEKLSVIAWVDYVALEICQK